MDHRIRFNDSPKSETHKSLKTSIDSKIEFKNLTSVRKLFFHDVVDQSETLMTLNKLLM